jgi:hypothetical protein
VIFPPSGTCSFSPTWYIRNCRILNAIESLMTMEKKMELSPGQSEELIRVLKARFDKNMNRHEGLEMG